MRMEKTALVIAMLAVSATANAKENETSTQKPSVEQHQFIACCGDGTGERLACPAGRYKDTKNTSMKDLYSQGWRVVSVLPGNFVSFSGVCEGAGRVSFYLEK